VPPDHDSAFLNDGSRIGIVVPVLPGDILVEPLKEFNEKDRATLAREVGVESPDLFNVFAKKGYWRGRTVFLDKRAKYLDLSKPTELIEYLIVRADSDRIAPGPKERFDKGTYKFVIVEEGQELEDKVTRQEDMKTAYKIFGKIEGSVDRMKDFMFVYYLSKKEAKKPPHDAKADWLKAQIQEILDTDLQGFLEIMADQEYDIKLLITKSVFKGFLLRKQHHYYIPGDEHPVGVLTETVNFLKDDKNQEFKMKLMQQVENTEA